MRNIFVSSTFQDMQAERDIIRQKVFPALNKVAESHNDHIEFTDLRWGIDTLNQSEQEASIKIMNVCLNELRRSDSLMVILLGDRYGWVPDAAYLTNLQVPQDDEFDKKCVSATAFEIEQGVFCGDKRALVYLRKLENVGENGIPKVYFEQNSVNRRNLEELKERLKNSPNCKVQEYSARFKDGEIEQDDLDSFANRLTKDLESAFGEEWNEFDHLSDFDREQDIQWEFIRRKAQGFYARKEESDHLMQMIRSWSNEPETGEKISSKDSVHFIIGPSGSGKSTMLAEIAVRLRNEGWDVLPFVGGLTQESSDAISVLRNVVYYLEEQLEIEHKVKFGAGTVQGVTGENEEKGDAAKEHITKADLNRQKLQERLLEVARLYADGHDPLVVLIDALDQFYPDENRDNLSFCPQKLNGSVRFVITCTPEFRTGAADKTVLKNLKKDDRLMAVRGVLKHRHKEISAEVISNLLERKSAETPLYISMAMDRLMLMDRKDFRSINGHGGKSDAIALHQKDIIAALPDELGEMAVVLFEKAGEKIGQAFTHKALQYMAVSRQGIRESDLAYCMEKEWDSVAFSNLLYYLNDQFLLHSDGRIDFTHKVLRQGVLSGIRNANQLHLKLEWCYHEKNVEDSVRTSEILYHCSRRNDYKYAASVVRPIVYQNFTENKDLLAITSRGYGQAIAAIAMPDRGEWVQKWLGYLAEDAKRSKADDKETENSRWNSLWNVLWFLNMFVLAELPVTQAGNETGGAITKYMLDALNDAGNGTWSEKNRKYLIGEIRRKLARYKSIAGDLWAAQVEWKKIFKKSQADYEALNEKDYASWNRMFATSYNWLSVMKSSSDHNVLTAALEPATYGISLLSEKAYVDKYLNVENCLIGMLYGCIGEVCERLDILDANLLSYEQDLRYREEIYRRCNSATALLYYTGSYHNISQVYLLLGLSGEQNFKDIYAAQSIFFAKTNHPLKLLPVIRFGTNVEKTAGEMFMEHCHEEPPVIASLLSKNREIELLERALQLNQAADWFKNQNAGFLGADSIWQRYWEYGVFYFNTLVSRWDPSDKKESDFFNGENIRIAMHRLCKALEYCWESFFDDSTVGSALNLYHIGESILHYRKYIGKDEKDEVFDTLGRSIHKAEEFLKGCLERDSARGIGEDNAVATNTEYARWAFLNSCILYSQITLSIDHSGRDEDIAFQWCVAGLGYISNVGLWVDIPSGKVIKKPEQNNAIAKSETDSEFEKYILTWREDCTDILRYLKQEKMIGEQIKQSDSQDEHSDENSENPELDKDVYKEWVSPDGKSWYRGWWKNGLRNGFGEAKFQSGSSYKGEWKDGEPEGYGIRIDIFGKASCGIFEEGEFKKALPKAVVNLKLMKYKAISR